MSDFSTRLSALREQKGWSKTYVAKQIGLTSMQTYANYEYGRREPDFETTKKLANLFTSPLITYSAATPRKTMKSL